MKLGLNRHQYGMLFERTHKQGAERHPTRWLTANDAAISAIQQLEPLEDEPSTKALVSLVVLRVLDRLYPPTQRTGDKYWEDLVKQVGELITKLRDKPQHLKLGFRLHPGSILNAYREGDLTFDEAVEELQVMISEKSIPNANP